MLLAVDTSTSQVGLAGIDGNRVVFESVWYSALHHTIELAPGRATPGMVDLRSVAPRVLPDDLDGVDRSDLIMAPRSLEGAAPGDLW